MTKGTAVRREAAADNRDDVIWDRRYKHRHAGLAGVYSSRDVIQMQVLISAGDLSRDDAPTPPDPSDRSMSKRQWELGIHQLWKVYKYIDYIVSNILFSSALVTSSPHPWYAGLAQRGQKLHRVHTVVSEASAGR
jgi:hypothetical protein